MTVAERYISHLIKIVKLDVSSQQTFQTSRKDWVYLIKDGIVPAITRRFKIAHGNDIDAAVQFILHQDHVHLLSWGTKHIKISIEWNIFPEVMRKMNPESMYRQYFHAALPKVSDDVVGKVGRSSVLPIVEIITKGNCNARAV